MFHALRDSNMGITKAGLVAFFFFLQISIVSGQEVWSDDFEDQNLTDSPEWTGDTGNFVFTDVDGNTMLQLNAPEAGASYLSTPVTSLYGTWRWFFRMDFSLSGSNRIAIFLQSDAVNPDNAQNAIFLQAGESGSGDVFELVHRNNGSETVLETGSFNVDAGGGFQMEASHTEENGWEISINSDYGSSPEPDFSAPTLLLGGSSYFSIQSTYTATRTDLFYFDDISFNKEPTKVNSFSTTQNRYVVLEYSDHLTETSLNSADFALSDESADAVTLLDPYTVQADFGELPSGTSDFTAAVFSDLYGFDTESFTETITLTADFNPGDIVINEFMYAPESGDAEFVEIINLSDKLIDLNGWILQDNTSTEYTVSNSELLINPGEYLVLTSDTANVNALYGFGNYHQMSSFPALNNSSPDAVRITTDSDLLVDSVAYEQSWGGDRVSLEKRSVSAPSVYQENWGSSESPDGATPGEENSIGPDSDPPALSSASFLSDVEILLLFDDVLDEESAGNSSNFSISDKTISDVRFGKPDSVFITVSTAFENAQSYTVTSNGVEDIFGNVSASLQTELTFYEVTGPTQGSLLISEFLYDPPTDFTEFIEFYNPGPAAIDLSEVELADNRLSFNRLFSNSQVVAPESYIVVTPDNVLVDEFPDRPVFSVGSAFPSLNNSGDAIVIRSLNGVQIDSLQYVSGWGGNDVALERRSFSVTATVAANWGDAPNGFGTPGLANEIQPDTEPPFVETLFALSVDSVFVEFSEAVQTDISGINVSFDPALSVDRLEFQNEQKLLILLDDNLVENQPYDFSLNGVKDLFDNEMAPLDSTIQYVETSTAQPGDLVITEFMYDPGPGYTEFIEIFNRSGKYLNLAEISWNDSGGDPELISRTDLVLSPDTFAVLTPDETLLDLFPDINLVNMGSRFSALNNGDDVIVLYNSAGVTLDSLFYTSAWGGNEVSLERRDLSFAANIASNWGDSPSPDGSTAGRENEIQPDTEPPFVETLFALSKDSVFVEFSEAIQTDVSTIDVSFDPALSVDRFEFQNEQELLILLDDNLVENQPYAFSLSGAKDLFDNEMEPLDSTIQYVETSTAQPGDLVITEFMYDPGPGYTEFIEIFNRSGKYLNLAEISWNDSGGDPELISRADLVLPPDTFAVLTPDETLLDLFPDINLVNMGSRFSALNNGDDMIVLFNSAGVTLDSLLYTSAWGGDEVSLERRDINVTAFFASNWGDSPSPDGSTAGRENEVEKDTEAPMITSVSAFDHSVKLDVSEQLDSTVTEDNLQISINKTVTISRTAVSLNGVEVFFNENLSEGTTYEIVLSGLTDIFGNVSAEETKSFIFVNPLRPERKSLLITEFVYLEDAGNVPEFVEIYNNTESYIDLGAVKVGDDRASEIIEPLNEGDQSTLIIAPGNYKAVTYDVSFASRSESIIAIQELPSFNNFGGDAVVLRNADDDSVIDSLLFDDTWPAVRAGEAMARVNLESATADPSKWVAATQTAGAENEVLRSDDTPPELLFSGVISPDTLTLIFNEFIEPQGISITGNGMEVPVIEVAGDRVLADAAGLNPVEPNSISIESVEDVAGNEISALQDIPVAVQLSRVTNKPVINEILFDPINDPGFEQSEFIELYNPTPFSLILPDEAFSVFSRSSERTTNLEANVTRAPKVIKAKSFVTFFADTALTFANTRFAQSFEIDESEFNEAHFQIDRTTLSMANSNSVVLFSNDEGAVVDSLPYDESWTNPNIPDKKGKSLERIRYSSATDLSGNWTSSAAEIGATPGAVNSVAMTESEEESENKITISVNPFSPDSDGFEDHTTVDYKFDHANYLLTIRIFDQYGRTVRLLTDQRSAGASGSVIWDGNNDDGEKCRFGRYILLVTAHDATAGKKKTYKKTVVIATN